MVQEEDYFQLYNVSTSSKPFSIECKIGKNQTPLRTLIDTCAAGGNFINEATAQLICRIENIMPRRLKTPLAIKAFNDVSAPQITHAISVPLWVGRHYEDHCILNITNLGRRDMILGIDWMEEHGCVPNPITRDVIFLGGHCTHKGAPIPIPFDEEPALEKKKRKRKTMSKSQKLRLKEDERLANATTPFHRSTRCALPKEVDEDEAAEYYESWEPAVEISCIGACAMANLISQPEAVIAAISMKDIVDQHKKEETEDIDPQHLLPEVYHEFIDVFLKIKSDTLPPYRKSDHQIELEEGKEPNWVPRLYRMTREEMEEVRRWITKNLSDGFIKASQSP